jgi:formylglycine-generating enzyme required for sulfatase activity
MTALTSGPPVVIPEPQIDPKALPWQLWDGKESVARYAQRTGLPATRTILLGEAPLELMLVPAGSFLMGSTEQGEPDEKPLHRVVISRPFYLGKYELTQEQYTAVTGKNPSYFIGKRHPVEQVSWFDAQAFLQTAGHSLRLPTEAEWEFACRAGSTLPFQNGSDLASLSATGWWGHSVTQPYGNAPEGPSEVGGKAPNAFGLYDMHGNVYEWCSDPYTPDFYSSSPVLDPQGPPAGEERVLRGGSWESDAATARSANRNGFNQRSRGYMLGFRVAASIPEK